MVTALSFGAWLRQQRRQLDLTQAELAQRVGCAVVTIRKFEADELRPSKQMAERLAECLHVVPTQAADFTAFARSTSSFATRADIPPRQHTLPLQLTPFVGRTSELAELDRLLADPTVRLLTLLGPGGIGKTRLVIEVASVQLERFPQGVTFVALAAVESAAAIIPLIAEALNFTFYAEGTPRQQLGDYLRHKTMLLVLDNFEQLLDAPHRPDLCDPDEPNGVALLLDLLQAAPQLKLLVTSRVRLNVQGEQLYRLTGIDFPQDDQFTGATTDQSSAVALFVQSAQRVQPSFALTHANSAPIADICRLVQGMPLAILLAAAWVEMLTPAEILAELGQGDQAHQTLDFLATNLRDIPARQRSLRLVCDHSWRLLSAEEQAHFAQLSLFSGGFTRQAAQAVTGTTTQALLSLVNKSLVRRHAPGNRHAAGQDRYDLHELLRQYAAERLAQMPEASEATGDRHSRFYCTLLGAQEVRLKGAEQQAGLTQIELELDNMRRAWQWAAEHQQHERLAHAMPSLGLFYQWRSRYQEGEAAYGYAVRHLTAQQPQAPAVQLVLAQALAWQAVFMRLAGRLQEASDLLQQSLAYLGNNRAADQETERVNAFILLQMGRLSEAQADFAACKRCYQHALTIYATLADGWGKAHALAGLGEIGYRSGDLIPGRRFYEESLALYQMAGDQRNSAHVLEGLGYILRDQGQLDEAEASTTKSLALYALLGDRAKLAAGHYALAWSSIYLGRFGEAYAQVEKCIAIQTDLGLPTSLILPGLLNLELGKYEAAHAQLQTQLLRSRATHDKDQLSLGLDVLSCLAIVEGRYADAQVLVTEAIALHQEIGEQARLAHAQAFAGYAARGLGQRTLAQHYFFQALQSTDVHDGFLTLLFVLPGIALLLADGGETERAIEIYAQIADVPLVANSQMRWDLAGAQLAQVADTLPPEIVAAARARGRAGDLWATATALLLELGSRGWGM